MGEASPESSDSASSTEDVLVRFRSSSKCSFHCQTISSVLTLHLARDDRWHVYNTGY